MDDKQGGLIEGSQVKNVPVHNALELQFLRFQVGSWPPDVQPLWYFDATAAHSLVTWSTPSWVRFNTSRSVCSVLAEVQDTQIPPHVLVIHRTKRPLVRQCHRRPWN